jgi:hypothetical protein
MHIRRGAGRHAALALFTADIDLDAHIERRQLRVALRGQAFGDLQPIDAMHPVEGIGHRPRLIALQRTDEVPFQLQAGKLGDLVHAFLHIVLAKRALAGRGSVTHGLRRPGLAHRKQSDRGGIAPHGLRRACDALAHGLHVRSD